MQKKLLFICVLLFVFGFTGIASATPMDYPPNGPRDQRLKMRYSADDIRGFLKKVQSWKSRQPGLAERKIERKLLYDHKLDILKKLLGGNSDRWKHIHKMKEGPWFAMHKRCNPNKGNPVPEPATMLLLGSGLVVIAGFGRKKFKGKSKK